MQNKFSPWRAGLAMTGAGLVIAGTWAAAAYFPGEVFLGLARFAVLLLLLPVIHTVIQFLAEISRQAWERRYWRSRPDVPQPPTTPTELASGLISYNVDGQPQPPLAPINAAELRAMQLRRACIAFLQAGHAIGNVWGYREMKRAGLLERKDWDTCIDVLRRAGLITSEPGEGTYPYPDYATALDKLRQGVPLPLPDGPIPTIARQHSTARPHGDGANAQTLTQ